jgi:hypothetical protein
MAESESPYTAQELADHEKEYITALHGFMQAKIDKKKLEEQIEAKSKEIENYQKQMNTSHANLEKTHK